MKENIRGGHSFINIRDAKTDEAKNIHLTYLDVNNLYGKAQSELLPTDQYGWLTETEVAQIDWSNIDTEADIGYICEVDLHYPPELHHK